MKTIFWKLLLACCVVLQLGCASDKYLRTTNLDWVVDGTTTRAAVIEKWGDPVNYMAQGKILFYRVQYSPLKFNQWYRWSRNYSLDLTQADLGQCYASYVLISDSQGIIRYHAEVPLKQKEDK